MPAFTGFKFDRARFFQEFRTQFGAIPADKQYVVIGLERLLAGFETYYGWWDDLRQIANAFAQVGWETAFSYTPVVEAYYLGDPDKPGFFQGNTQLVRTVQQRFWYWPHIGRGDIQCTHAENYAEADAYIRKYFPERVEEFERRTGTKFDLVRHPDQMFDGWISFCTFTVGMHLGLFRRGHNLDRYISPTRCDHYAAREIVNGDKGKIKPGQRYSIGRQIEAIAKKFEIVLKAALIEQPQHVGAGGAGLFVPPLSDDEINIFDSQIGEAPTGQTGAAEPNVAGNGEPTFAPVDPGAGADPSLWQGDASAPPVGDPPDAPAKYSLDVEDWKPWAKRIVARTWKWIGSLSVPGTGVSLAGITSGNPYALAAGAAAIGLILLLIVGGVIASIVVVGIYLWNNKDIPMLKQWAKDNNLDPTKPNVALNFIKK
jgi:hypothetical protein